MVQNVIGGGDGVKKFSNRIRIEEIGIHVTQTKIPTLPTKEGDGGIRRNLNSPHPLNTLSPYQSLVEGEMEIKRSS